MKRFHISPQSGEPKPCRAKPGNCPHGEDKDHFGTEEAARKWYEKSQNAVPEAARKKKIVGGKYDGERDVVDGRPGRWSTSITTGWGPTAKPTFFPDDAGMEDDPASLPNSFEDDESWRKAARRTLSSGMFVGFADAQRDSLAAYNGEDRDDPRWMTFNGPVGDLAEELSSRLLAGETSRYDHDLRNRNFKQMSPKEMVFSYACDQSAGEQQTLDLMLAFPDRDLAPVLEKLGVDHVSVAALKNGREVGLVYTVMTPSGGTRSFSIYEHRNTDSVIINGQEDWDPATKPYGPYPEVGKEGGSKWDFFAEFSVHAPRKQIAESLGYLLKAAQKGELESDDELVAKAEKLDWGAILSKQIPAFGEWLDKKKKDHYESDKFIEDSFAAWERDF